MSEYDILIIGGGAAGLSAALVLSRARRKVLVVDSGTPRNSPAAHMHGFLSRDGLPPGELLAVGRKEVKGYGGKVVDGEVKDLVRCSTSGFSVRLSDGQRFSARRLLVATGLRDELPDIPGLRDRWARDVLHCPYCHGYEVRDQQLGVLGGSPDAVRYAQIVRQWTDDVVFFAPTGTLTEAQRSQMASRGIEIVEGTVKKMLVENDHLRGVELDGRTIRRSALFVHRASSRTTIHSSAWAATSTRMGGWSPAPTATRAFPVYGSRATSPTHERRSSPPPVRDPRPPSRSTPTWSTKTSRTPSGTSIRASHPETASPLTVV